MAVVQYTFIQKQYTERNKKTTHRTTQKFWKIAGRALYTLAFALQLRKKYGKTSVRVAASKNT